MSRYFVWRILGIIYAMCGGGVGSVRREFGVAYYGKNLKNL